MPYRLEQTLGFSLHRAAALLRQAVNQELRHYDLTSEQFAILALLWQQDGVAQRTLAARLFKDKPNVTRMVQRLADKGLIERRPDPRDRRVVRIHITPAGLALEKVLLERVGVVRDRAYRGLDADAQERLKRLLDRITGNLS